ncbi:hypothetical protein AALO_G00219490 [Alosa alosa]|uniref:Uncharacterized protein n=1 Tax=Alosa alosa TaxID=278164 RepID=A0AAV6FXF0_9TELE|nr:hypothetical protein AALO_G00219490 [Alosa alosa]
MPSLTQINLYPRLQISRIPGFQTAFSSTICRFISASPALAKGSGEMGNRGVKTCQRSIFCCAPSRWACSINTLIQP